MNVVQRFQTKCGIQKIEDLSSAAQAEKAKLIAKQCGLAKWDNIAYLQSLINAGKAEQASKERERAGQEKIKLEEYADYRGREKEIAYYDSIIAQADEIITKGEETRELAEKSRSVFGTYIPTGPKKRDWAIRGGIAAGLAGPAAGIAVAMDAQHKNMVDQLNAHENAERERAAAKASGDNIASLIYLRGVSQEKLKEARAVKRENLKLKNECAVMLTDETHPSELLFGLLEPKAEIKVKESGILNIRVTVQSHLVTIYDTTPAVIDGSFGGLIWNQRDECCGAVAFVLPLMGVSRNMTINGICVLPETAKADDSYTLEFVHPNLWFVETKTERAAEILDFSAQEETVFSEQADSYYQAQRLMDTNQKECVEKAEERFVQLGSWKDAKSKAEQCRDRFPALRLSKYKEIEQDIQTLNKALEAMDAEIKKKKQAVPTRHGLHFWATAYTLIGGVMLIYVSLLGRMWGLMLIGILLLIPGVILWKNSPVKEKRRQIDREMATPRADLVRQIEEKTAELNRLKNES